MTCIPVNPELLTCARECAGLDTLALAGLAETCTSQFQGRTP